MVFGSLIESLQEKIQSQLLNDLSIFKNQWFTLDNGIFYKLFDINIPNTQYEKYLSSENKKLLKFYVLDGEKFYKILFSYNSSEVRSMSFVRNNELIEELDIKLLIKILSNNEVEVKIPTGFYRFSNKKMRVFP